MLRVSPPFRLQTLGRLELTRDGALTGVRRRKELGLLAYLARRAPRPVDRDVAMTLFWGDRPEAKARTSLRQALFEIRTAVGDALVAEGAELRIDPARLTVDASEFEADLAAGRFRDATERWGGIFLAGLEDLGDDRWASWLEGERAALTHGMMAALDHLGTAAEAAGDWPAVVRHAERHLELAPENHAAEQRLLLGYRRTGQEARAAAVEARSGTGPVARGIGRPGLRGLVSPDLVGRTRTLAELVGVFEEVRAGPGKIVLIEGAAGIGKSRLLTELVRTLGAAGGRTVVASTKAFASQRDRPWTTVRPLLAGVGVSAQGVGAAPPDMLARLAAVVPELAERFPGLPAPVLSSDPVAAAFRLVLDAAVEQPVALVVDDAPDADPESQSLLGALIRHPPAGMLLVVSGRPDAWPGSALSADVTPGGPWIKRLSLAPLSERQVADLVGSMAPFTPADLATLAERVHREAGGVPGLVATLVSQLAEAGLIGPDGDGAWRVLGDLATLPTGGDFRKLVLESIASLPAGARAVLNLAAVLGPRIDADVLERAGGLDPGGYDSALGALIAGRHLREPALGPGRLEFGSEAVRRAVYHGLVPSIRAGLHRRAAGALRSRTDPESAAEARRHREAAGRFAPRRRWLIGAAALGLGLAAAWWQFGPGRRAPTAPGTAVLLADLANATGEPLFDGSLAVVARVQLQQSPQVWIVPRNQIVAALARMGRRDTAIVVRGELAREVALRENVPLVVELDVSRGGTDYVVIARLINARTGADLASVAARARDQGGVLDAVTEVVVKIRGALGEPVRPDSTGGLVRVTTGSLEALQQFSFGDAAWDRRDWNAAARYWQRAAELDSTFGMAQARLANYYFQNQNDRPAALARVALAERFAARMTEPERLVLAGTKAAVEGDRGAASQALAMLANRYPTPANLSNYAIELFRGRRCEEALPVFRRSIALRPTPNVWINMATCYQALDSLEAALGAYGEAGRLDSMALYDSNINQEWGLLLVRTGRPAAAESAFRRMTTRPSSGNQARGFRSLAFLAMHQGRYREALSALDQSLARYRSIGGGGLSVFRTLVLKAHAAASLGEPKVAAEYLEGARAAVRGEYLEPNYSARAVAAHLRIGDRAGALRWLGDLRRTVIVSSRADSVALRLALAYAANAAGRFRPALDLLATDPGANPPLAPEHWSAMGAAYAGLGRPDSALAIWRRAREQQWGGGTEAQDGWDRLPLRMAEVALQLGDTVQAQALLQEMARQWSGADSGATDVRRVRSLVSAINARPP